MSFENYQINMVLNMKNWYLRIIPIALICTISIEAWAYDFKVDGIYYKKISDTKVAVTYGTKEYNTYNSSNIGANVVIPKFVETGGKKYVVTAIGTKAFYDCGISTISLPESITTIEESAFRECSITSIVLPDFVTTIGNWAFLWCDKLEKVNIPEGVVSIGRQTFEGCAIETIQIPDEVKYLDDYAFRNCKKLHTITGLSGVTSIGEETFSGCESLNSIIIPSGVKLIPEKCFANCSQLKSLTISEGIECINTEAFSHCDALTSVHIPSSLQWIRSDAFAYCRNLIEITVSMDNNYFDSRDNSNAIISKNKREGSYELYRTDHSTTYAIFSYKANEIVVGCSGLSIPESVTSCLDLYGCYIPSLKLPKGFMNLGNLHSCHIGEAYVEGGNDTYDSRDNCNAIVETATNTICAVSSKTIIPEGIITINGDFRPYSDMKCLYSYASTPPTLYSVRYRFTTEQFNNVTIYVPKGSKAKYLNSDGWNLFSTIQEFEPSGIVKPLLNVNTKSLYYNISGQQTKSPKKGINIIKKGDGTSKKVFVK